MTLPVNVYNNSIITTNDISKNVETKEIVTEVPVVMLSISSMQTQRHVIMLTLHKIVVLLIALIVMTR